MTFKLPKIISHRGCKGYAPENTLASIHTAADMDLEWVEIDIMLTQDGVPVLFHGYEIDELTNGSGELAKTTFSDLEKLDAGSHFQDSFYGEKVPSLEQALDILIERNMSVKLDIRPTENNVSDLTETTLDIISRSWDTPHTMLISSSNVECLEIAHAYLEAFPRDWAMIEPTSNWEEIAQNLDLSALTLVDREDVMNEFQIKAIKKKGYPLIAATINDESRADQLFEWGVDCIISDYPDIIE